MAIFTSAAVATFLVVEATFLTSAIAFGLNAAVGVAASLGLSFAAKALAGNKNESASSAADHFGVQGALAGGGDVPRSFNVGYSVTAGSLVYANTSGGDTTTPNAYLHQVIALSDMPGGTLEEVWINGELCTLDLPGVQDVGYPVNEYKKGGAEFLWIKYYDGTQTVADPFLVSTFSADPNRPYESTRVGTGVAYVICTSLVEDTLFTNGVPTFKFALSGMPLYDPTKDSTNGGSGLHRWADPATWGGDGDNFPVVQAYNIMRGVYFDDVWLYGLQRMTSARLPAANWNAQIEKCRADLGGFPTYRSGGQINVNAQIANTVEAFLTACQGRVSEIGGSYKIRVGAPDSPTFSFTDDDILSTEPQSFAPFFGLADSINGITSSGPDPAQGWNTSVNPPIYDEDFEFEDGSRRLLANPSFDFVPYLPQRQRLQASALAEARRARRHNLVFGPAFWTVEPGDVGAWTSVRNNYTSKQFRADGALDKANLDVALNLTEVDSADYDPPVYIPVVTGTTYNVRPAPQGVVDWFAEPWTLPDSDGIGRRPAIRLTWDGTVPGVVGVQYEVRLAADNSAVTKGRTDQLAAAAIIVSQSLIPNTEYEVRGQYLPSSPRDMLWSDWLSVTTPDVRLSESDIDDAIRFNLTTLNDQFQDRLDEIEQKFATLASKIGKEGWTDIKSVRSQLAARSDAAFASIEEVRTVAVDNETAFASYQLEVSATFGPAFSTVSTVSEAFATVDGWGAARHTVKLNVNNAISGTELINGGPGLSKTIFASDAFQFQSASVNGGTPVDFLEFGTVGGITHMVLLGNFTADGYVLARMVAANQIQTVHLDSQSVTTAKLDAQSVTAGKMATNSITAANGAIDSLAVKTFNIGDAAVTAPFIQILASDFIGTGSGATIFDTSGSFSVDSTGLGTSKFIYVSVDVYCPTIFSAVNIPHATNLSINGSSVASPSFTSGQYMIMSGSLKIATTGANQVIAVVFAWNSPNTGKLVAGSTMRILATIR